MDDPTQPEVGERLAAALREGTLRIPGVVASAAMEVHALGTGESYAAWKVVDGSRAFVVRIPRRPPADTPTEMMREFEASSLMDSSVGSCAVAMDDGRHNPLGSPYIVSTFVPGAVFAPSRWNKALLMGHARQLAKFHGSRRKAANGLGIGEDPVDIVREFDEGYAWWQEAHPEVTDNANVEAVGAAIRRRLIGARPWFEGMRTTLIHGDLVATNIVVDTAGVPRYIDWEWARIGDVAQDLAYIGGHVVGGPWYVPMKPATVDAFIVEYVSAAATRAHGNNEPFERLLGRRDAWELCERFLSSLHFAKQARTLPDPGYYPAAVRSLHATLRTRLNLAG